MNRKHQRKEPGINLDLLKVDRTAFSVAPLGDDADEKAYWLSQPPLERLRHVEILRCINYGHRATARLQRVLEVAPRPWS